MHSYRDMHYLTEVPFYNALRLHLSGFKVPGEVQDIDRIMEKYASRFCKCNTTIFANADAPYVLTYSTLLLYRDAHNDTIKNKMTKEEFIKTNRAVRDWGDLDAVFLGSLCKEITTTEIRLTSTKKDSTDRDSKALKITSNTMDPAQTAKQFEESERFMAHTKVLFAKNCRPAQDHAYHPATNVHLARLMFESAWSPVLAAISLNPEKAQTADTSTTALCRFSALRTY
ncbi:Brefeldin A-inhibited guanine nucleotide-exchange protein 1 [Gracilariopsis chorda]|uniref:Brefeldin A-inhibited guanine nucleotide-exchange protein 1 n=1 Tax=Gracilariopsis chorda TaxID=448386 RepID=A0A2V3J6F8_9FLOR|nr:Brefeldin A-inhibited guanine nucleotide-exchange protein 1 [Gracilariopsis chorda]|eukprot:PXF49712.1 Brefeldin A-inhibited guanine nucleotide-exchange protein 1 [Gracilariopsis chorda]